MLYLPCDNRTTSSPRLYQEPTTSANRPDGIGCRLGGGPRHRNEEALDLFVKEAIQRRLSSIDFQPGTSAGSAYRSPTRARANRLRPPPCGDLHRLSCTRRTTRGRGAAELDVRSQQQKASSDTGSNSLGTDGADNEYGRLRPRPRRRNCPPVSVQASRDWASGLIYALSELAEAISATWSHLSK
ncbi:hypothetical protein CDD83_4035 [Cordyceps sp. RAO-2017]|nr:hypothetical protein CDD83_4035 [Cordyceps sp. RAO-2017]